MLPSTNNTFPSRGRDRGQSPAEGVDPQCLSTLRATQLRLACRARERAQQNKEPAREREKHSVSNTNLTTTKTAVTPDHYLRRESKDAPPLRPQQNCRRQEPHEAPPREGADLGHQRMPAGKARKSPARRCCAATRPAPPSTRSSICCSRTSPGWSHYPTRRRTSPKKFWIIYFPL